MYGMVNEGIRTFIESNFGAAAWDSICGDADIEMTQFDRLGSYDDAVTYSLVGAVAKHTELPPEKVLKVFGEYWVDYAGQSGFGNLLKLSGKNFVERVQNLDDMHERILLTMPNLEAAIFRARRGWRKHIRPELLLNPSGARLDGHWLAAWPG